MNWKTETHNKRKILVSGDFKIIPCKNGKQQLREAGKMCGTFTDADAAKAHAAFLLEQREPPKPRREGRTRHQKIFGHSVCSVVKALGRAGMEPGAVEAVLRDHGIEMSPRSLRVQLGFGRNEHTWARHGKPADLTGDQLKFLGIHDAA